MDPILTTLLLAVLALAGLLFYVFIVRREPDPGGRGMAGLITLLFVLVPVLLITLWLQSDSAQRLSDTGFVPHPALVSTVGVAAGVGENPVWVYSIAGDPRDIVQFYRDAGNHPGWQQVSDSENMLIFETDDRRMSLFVSDNSAIFALHPVQ